MSGERNHVERRPVSRNRYYLRVRKPRVGDGLSREEIRSVGGKFSLDDERVKCDFLCL